MRTIKRKTKIYSVNWYHGSHCYRTTIGCTWKDIKNYRRTAKLFDELTTSDLEDILKWLEEELP